MILPQTYFGTLLLLILGTLCLGSWANLYKMAGKWRYELFYFDFAIGLGLTAVIAGFTVGSLGFDGFRLTDDLVHAGQRQWMWALAAGLIFNLGNMLLMAAVSVAGMAVAFPIGMGLALVITLVAGSTNPAVSGRYLLLGAVLVLAAVVADAAAYIAVIKARRAALPAPAGKKRARGPSPLKGLVLSAGAGVVISATYPLLAHAGVPEVGLGPFSLAFLFAFSAVVSTFVYNIFLMNLPVDGDPVELLDYFKARPKLHLFGFAAGVIWCVGTLANWVSGAVDQSAQVSRAASLAFSQGSVLVALLWGVALWKDLRGSAKAQGLAVLVAVLFACGLGLVAIGLTSQPRP